MGARRQRPSTRRWRLRSSCLLAAICAAYLVATALNRSEELRSAWWASACGSQRQASADGKAPAAAAAAAAAAAVAAAATASFNAATPSSKPLRLLFVGHELSLTGAPLALFELALRMRERGHTISFLATRGGPLEEVMQHAGVAWSRITDIWGTSRDTAHSEPIDPAQYDAILVNTVVLHPWLRAQMEAWGLAFMRKVVWWVHELPQGITVPLFTDGDTVQRALLARTPAVIFDSEASRSFWEKWVLDEAEWLGLEFSPLVGKQFSFEPRPKLPTALPALRTLHLPRPDWMGRLLGEQPECSKSSTKWPHADLRRQFRARINATDADYVVLFVGTNTPPKGADGMLRAFVRAWQATAADPAAAGGRMLLLGIGHGMPDLRAEVEAQWAAVQAAGGTSWPAALPDAVHLLEASGDATERFGWYAAGDVQVVNSECENYGLVTVEGSAASLPLLGTACGGTQEIVDDGATGLLHPPPSAGEASDAALADHIRRLDPRVHDSRLLAAKMGTAGCRRVLSKFAPSTFYAAMEDTLQQVAANASAADAAAEGPEAPPAGGLPLDAGRAVRSGWAGAFMPDPRMQARIKAENMSWEWQELEPAPAVHFEGIGIKINNSLYLCGGYSGANEIVLPSLWRMDLDTLKWVDTNVTTVPDDMPETHQAAALVGNQHLYLIGGQKGPGCSPGSRNVYRLDMHTWQFSTLPPLPEARYFPTAAVFGSRLHVFGGIRQDRYHPAYNRWSIGLRPDGGADGNWRVEQPKLPEGMGGSHTTTIWLQPRFSAKPLLYVWGRTSQEYTPLNADAGDFRCIAHREWADSAMWSIDEQGSWRRHRDLPLPVQHTTMCTLKIGPDAVLIAGGQHYDRWLSRSIYVFNATEDSWTRVGTTPVYGKGTICAIHNGRLVMSGGQFGLENGANPGYGAPGPRQFASPLPPKLAAAAAEPAGPLCGLQC